MPPKEPSGPPEESTDEPVSAIGLEQVIMRAQRGEDPTGEDKALVQNLFQRHQLQEPSLQAQASVEKVNAIMSVVETLRSMDFINLDPDHPMRKANMAEFRSRYDALLGNEQSVVHAELTIEEFEILTAEEDEEGEE